MTEPLKSDALKKYRQEVDTYTLLTDTETRQLFQQLKESKTDEEKKEIIRKLFEAHLCFVIDIAESFTDIELILVDYIQEGNMALLSAIEQYDYTSEQIFLEFCTPLVYKAIQQYSIDNPSPDQTIQVAPRTEK